MKMKQFARTVAVTIRGRTEAGNGGVVMGNATCYTCQKWNYTGNYDTAVRYGKDHRCD